MASKWARHPTRPLYLADMSVKLTMPCIGQQVDNAAITPHLLSLVPSYAGVPTAPTPLLTGQ